MDAMEVALIALVAVLATAFALTLLARLRDFGQLRDHQATRRLLEDELAAARSRITELEHVPEPQPAGRFSRG
jgi:hypothetical protein